MKFLSLLWQRVRAAARPDAVHEEIADELQFHVEMKADELMRRGLAPADAHAAAARAFGSTTRLREQGYDVRGGGLPEQLWGDLRFAVRLMRKQWMKTAILVTTVALGVGVNSAVFGVVRSVLLQPLAFPHAGELMVLRQSNHGDPSGVSYPNFQDWRTGARSFQGMAVYAATSATLTGQGDATVVAGAITSASLFRVLGVRPVRGRLFDDADDRYVSRAAVGGPILISDRLWRARFGGRDDVLGQTMHLDGKTFQVVGIIPASSAFPLQKDAIDYWTTVAVDADPALYGGTIPLSRGYPRYDGAVARLAPGVTVEQARQEMTVLAARIARAHPKATSSNEVVVRPALEEVVGGSSRTMILILYASALCVLLVACINAANLLLVDALGRRREFSLRMALGAPAIKLVRQLLVESSVIALSGGLVGVALAWLVLKLFLRFAPAETPRIAEIHLGAPVFFYAVAVSLICGLLFGCLPALSTRRGDLAGALKEGVRGVARRASVWQAGSMLIFGQIMIGMILTCCAGMLINSFRQIVQESRGFNPHGVLTASISLPIARYGQATPRVQTYYRTLLQAVRAMPGVEAATLAEVLPLSGQSNGTSVTIQGAPAEAQRPDTDLRFVDYSYFRAMQIPLVGGRLFDAADNAERPGYVIVNQAFVRRFLQGRDPYRTLLNLGWGGEKPKQIVGVVGDIRDTATSRKTAPEVYVPFAQFSMNDMAVLVRTAGNADPDAMAGALRDVARTLDPGVPLDRVRSLDDYLLLSSSQQLFLMGLLAAFAVVTVGLAAVGLYGVLSDQVSSRAHEFGIRLAVGSSKARVMRVVLSQGLRVTLAGVAIGAVATVFVSRWLQRWLYEGGPVGVAPLVLSGAILLVAAVGACWIPSRRAANCDPAMLLRAD